ncbi:MAG: Vancomycin B-type resistance protein VanW [Parcubacteria group bacterium ADurb.Bin326]|nr:MAG: Vancomycin B-type resistance protein VanW [Parcubacteria group bacterium ADurb.Bin326]
MFNLNNISEATEGDRQNKTSNTRWLAISLVAAIFILLVCGTIAIWFQFKYQEKIFPGVRVGNINLSGLNKQEAFQLINERTDSIVAGGIKVSYNGESEKELEVIALNGSGDPELSREIVSFNVYETVQQAYNFGRDRNILRSLGGQLDLLISGKKIPANYFLNESVLEQELKSRFADFEKKESSARPQINCLKDNCQVEVLSESGGLSLDYQGAVDKLKADLSQLNDARINLSFKSTEPQIKRTDVLNLTEEVLATASTTVIFSYQEKEWKLEKDKLYKILEFQKTNDEIVVGVAKEGFISWMKANISSQIDVPAKNATLEIRDGKITSLNAQQEGVEVDGDILYQELNQKLLDKEKTIAIEVKVKKVQPEVAVDSINDLGIKEIIGVGKSNFAGSPTNRRKNISNGAKILHGLLIKPDEEFALISKLLPIDAENGYFQELVIKGNKTVPEYGGGLCQIGTTMFRVALDSGLPILERRNHSYSVTYYLENGVPGVDATIYDPKPDLIFKNDTGHHILIQSRIEGDNLFFEFWGTKDGRQTERTKPKTWGWKDPPPTKYIETTDLAPGVKKCTESSHKGVTASFDYIVTSTDGTVNKQTFTSVYKPWQAVCLIGVTAVVSSSTESIATTTESIN